MASQKVAGYRVIVLSRALEYAFAPEKARCLVYGDGSDAGRLSFCEFIMYNESDRRLPVEPPETV